jgi:hypothetical protein
MKINNVPGLIHNFSNLFHEGCSFEIEFGGPWHFNECRGTAPPHADNEIGVYFYTCRNPKDWSTPIEQNEADIWYIGASNSDLGSRIWDHVGAIYEDYKNRIECSPRFKRNQWANDNSVPDNIKQSVAEGDIVIYTVAISPKDFNPMVLEKYLLACYYKAWGRLPFLNKGI